MEKHYAILYCDPPWDYDRKVGSGIARDHYQTMNIRELYELPVGEIADKDSILFLWVTFPMLKEALALIERWGFRYKTCAFNWVKRNKKADSYYFGLGFWTRTNAEVCLLATKGHPHRVSKKVPQVCDARIMEHSRKPPEIRERIVELCGDQPRIELFAREKAEGWDALGNEIDGRDIRDALKEMTGQDKDTGTEEKEGGVEPAADMD